MSRNIPLIDGNLSAEASFSTQFSADDEFANDTGESGGLCSAKRFAYIAECSSHHFGS